MTCYSASAARDTQSLIVTWSNFLQLHHAPEVLLSEVDFSTTNVCVCVCVSLSLSFSLSIFLSVSLSVSLYFSFSTSICLFTSIHPATHPSFNQLISESFHKSICRYLTVSLLPLSKHHLSLNLLLYLYIYQWINQLIDIVFSSLSIYRLICPPIHPSISLSICVFILGKNID